MCSYLQSKDDDEDDEDDDEEEEDEEEEEVHHAHYPALALAPSPCLIEIIWRSLAILNVLLYVSG